MYALTQNPGDIIVALLLAAAVAVGILGIWLED
jgi:hypothetical protein